MRIFPLHLLWASRYPSIDIQMPAKTSYFIGTHGQCVSTPGIARGLLMLFLYDMLYYSSK